MGGTGHRDRLTPPPEAVAAVAEALHRLPAGERVVLAVSGGPDSVGMAWLVRSARPDLAAAVVHVRHGLRDDAADAQAAIAHARALGLPWRVVSVTVSSTGTGPEDAARQQRLRALAGAAADARATAVLVGHTADDQTETVLLNLARGSGLPGLAGMRAWRQLSGDIAMAWPLLALRRATVRGVAAATGLPVADDPTNTDPAQRRARARHDLLPRLAALTGGGTDPVVALARLARHARRDTQALDEMALHHLTDLERRWGAVRTLPVAGLEALPDALSTRVVRLLLANTALPSEATVNAVLALRDGQVRPVPGGGHVSRGGGYLAFAASEVVALAERAGEKAVAVPEVGLTLHRTSTQPRNPVLPPWAPARSALCVRSNEDGTLRVRARRPGDRIVTTAGTQKLSDAMAAAHVPRLARDLVPVVEDSDGIVWVPGVAVRAGAGGPACLHFAPS